MEYQGRYQSRKPRDTCFRPRQVQHGSLVRFATEHDLVAVAQAQHDSPRRLADGVHALAFDTKEQPVE
jgi:hypothetical protein